MNKTGGIAACLLVIAGQGIAATFYVAAHGDDANTGRSLEQAWRSPARVSAASLQPGDSIMFEGGTTFIGGISFDSTVNGTPMRPITFTSFPTAKGRRARISSGAQMGFFAENCSGIRIHNLDFEGSGREADSDRGIFLVVRLAGSRKMEDFAIDSVDVRGYRWGGIVLEGARERSGLADVRITHCDVHDNGDAGIMSNGVFDPKTPGHNHRDITVAHCRVYNNSGVPYKGTHSGNGILLSSVDSALVEYNEAFNNGWLNDETRGGPVGIWCWESSHVIIQHNESHHNKTGSGVDGGGFDFDGGTRNSLMQYNYSHDNAGPGYLIAQFGGGVRTMSGLTIRYNISENDGGGFLLWTADSSTGVSEVDIYNNTVWTGSPEGGVSITGADFSSVRLMNNVLQTTSGALPVDARFTPDVRFINNCYWSSGEKFALRWGSARFTSLEMWRDSAGQEMLAGYGTTGLEADPMLERPGHRLMAGSPLIDAGLDLSRIFGIDSGDRDFFGRPLPRGSGYDIGAHEYERGVNNEKRRLDVGPGTGMH